jgi:hypothetical protein
MHLRRTIGAFALVAALGATAAACGNDNDDTVTKAPAAPSAADVAGSDQHLSNMASDADRAERAERAAAARLTAQAEAVERQAHLDGQANTYGQDRGLAEEQSAYQAGAAPANGGQ